MENEITIDRINNYLKSQLWMDFTLSSTDPGTAELIGRLDEAGGGAKIKILFHEPYLIISPLYFTYEGKYDFIAVLMGEYAYKKNVMYDIRQGNALFQLQNTNIKGDIIIAARKVSVEIMDAGNT